MIGAKKAQVEIDDNQNQIDIDAATLTRDLAKINLNKYLECDRGNSKADLEGQLEQAKDKSVWSRRMTAKGYVSFSQAEADRRRLRMPREIPRLTDFNSLRFEELPKPASPGGSQAEERPRPRPGPSWKNRRRTWKRKKMSWKQEQEKLKDLEEQIVNCTLYAPRDGMALYYVSEQMRSGFGTTIDGGPGRARTRRPNADSHSRPGSHAGKHPGA